MAPKAKASSKVEATAAPQLRTTLRMDDAVRSESVKYIEHLRLGCFPQTSIVMRPVEVIQEQAEEKVEKPAGDGEGWNAVIEDRRVASWRDLPIHGIAESSAPRSAKSVPKAKASTRKRARE